jgi:tetratricopeptide (TPR) repeat protein
MHCILYTLFIPESVKHMFDRLMDLLKFLRDTSEAHLATVTFALVIVTALLVLFTAKHNRLEGRKLREEKKARRNLLRTCRAERFNPADIVGAFHAGGITEYFPVPLDNVISGAMAEASDIGIMGRPGSGKSHTAAHHIQRAKGWHVLVPSRYAYQMAAQLRIKKRRYILLLDDLHEHAGNASKSGTVLELIESLRGQAKQLIVIATLRSTHPEIRSMEADLKLFGRWKWVTLSDWTLEEARKLAVKSGAGLEAWDGTPLSVKQPSLEMEQKYKQFLSPNSKALIRSIKLLSEFGIKPCARSLLRAVSSDFLNLPEQNFESALDDVNRHGFLKTVKPFIEAYAPYLDVIGDWQPQKKRDGAQLRAVLIRECRLPELVLMGASAYGGSDFVFAEVIFHDCIKLNPRNALYHYWLGLVLHMKGDLAEAEASLRSATNLAPKFALAHSRLARVLRERQSFREAVVENKAAIRLRPWSADEQFGLGLTYREMKDYARAEEALLKAIELRPKFALAWSHLGRIWRIQNKLPDALKACEAALELDPEIDEGNFDLGLTLLDLGNLVGAESKIREAIRLKPDLATAYSYLATILGRAGREEEAEQNARRAVEVAPDSAECRLSLGILLLKKGDNVAAEGALREAIRLKPDLTMAYSYLATILGETGREEEAEQNARRVVKLAPHSAECRLALGILLFKRGDNAAAEAALREAICLKPDLATAYSYLANILSRQSRWEEAAEADRKAAELAPQSAEAQFGLGRALLRKGDFASAEISFRKAISIDPRKARAYQHLGEALHKLGSLKQAVEALETAIQMNPNMSKSHYLLGLVWLQSKEYSRAKDALLASIRRKPDFAEAYEALGKAFEGDGQLELAIGCYIAAFWNDNTLLEAKVKLVQLNSFPKELD